MDILDVDITPINSISKKITDGFLSLADQRHVDSLIDFIIKESKTFTDIDNAIFDFIAIKYVWQLGYAYENAVKHPVGKYIKAIKETIFDNKNFFDSLWQKCYAEVPITLAKNVNSIVEKIKELGILSETECLLLRKRYSLKKIIEYSALTLPSDYPIKDCANLLDTVTHLTEFEEHLKYRYNGYPLLSKYDEMECVRVFYLRYKTLPLDLDI